MDVIALKVSPQSLPAPLATASTDEGQDQALSRGKEPPQRLIQYSVNMISLMGRLAGGLSTACLLILTMAAA